LNPTRHCISVDRDGPTACPDTHDINLCDNTVSNIKIPNIPKAWFCVKKYIISDPNKIESGINKLISVIVLITVPPIKSLNLLHTVGCSTLDIPI
jgi:hypothetical protein